MKIQNEVSLYNLPSRRRFLDTVILARVYGKEITSYHLYGALFRAGHVIFSKLFMCPYYSTVKRCQFCCTQGQ